MRTSFLSCFLAVAILSGCNSNKHVASATATSLENLNGTWVLNYISGPRIAFDGLYPDKKPEITITVADSRVSGNTSCNSFSGPLKAEGNRISFKEPMAMTKMACPGGGESVFVRTLEKINTYSISDDKTLTFIMGDVAMMRFSRK